MPVMSQTDKILILGAGKVAAPIVKYFLRKKYRVTVASEFLYEAEMILENNPLGEAVEWHSDDEAKLNTLVYNNHVVVSLLPYTFHHIVCKACIKQKRNLVTTSNEQPGMEVMYEDALKSKITILNEIGLNPGIDHMWAAEMIAAVKERGGEVEKFISVCGVLPSRESLDNPFRYKFSWKPLDVMRASSSEGKFMKNKEVIVLTPSQLMKNTFEVKIRGLGKLEAYANRNSLKYIGLYQIPGVETFFRGTLRYKGWCEVIDTLIEAGYLSEEPFPKHIDTYAGLTSYLTHIDNIGNLRDDFIDKLNLKTYSKAIMAMEWIGLFSRDSFITKVPNPLTVLTNRMVSRIKMLPSDRDLIVLNHQLLFSLPDGQKKMLNGVFTLKGRGNQQTAIADSVSYPAAMAVELLLNDKIPQKGFIRPIYPEIYQPILKKLKEDFKFKFKETELSAEHWPQGW